MSEARDRIVRELIEDIAASRFIPGAALPNATSLGRRCGATSNEAHEALRELADRGMAELTGDDGAKVAPESLWDVLDPRVLAALLATQGGPAILAEYLEYRRLIEVAAAGLAAEHATHEDLTQLSAALSEMRDVASDERFQRADAAFHHALLVAGRNRPLEQAAGPHPAALCTARRRLARPGLREARGLPEHQRILAAVAQHDPDAARDAMEAHLDTVEAHLREYADSVRAR